MVTKRDNRYILWPIYFEKSAAKTQGRRVSKKLAVDNPTPQDIFKAAQQLSLNPILEEKAYPSTHWKKGRVLVDIRGAKTEVIKSIAEKLYNKKV